MAIKIYRRHYDKDNQQSGEAVFGYVLNQ